MQKPQLKRRYHSPRRQAQAAATRERILAAAEQLFVSRGYAATTLVEIADGAGVALPTVTAAFGTKLALLNALIATTVRGDETPLLLSERDWWQAALAEQEPVQLLTLYAANIRRIHERTTDIFEIVRGAATADAEIAALRRDLAAGRLSDSQQIASALDSSHALRADLPLERATDVIWALVSAELYRLLATERGWQPDDYERWLADTLIASLLP
jgi:AcrR family transcriptional regulator